MQWGRQFRRVLRSTVVVIGGLVALLIVGTALFANSLAPNPPDEQNFDLVESAPGAKALFGTDRFGRDVLSRVIYGSRTSLYVARSEEHTSELQSPCNLVCRLLLEKKKNNNTNK